MSQTKTWISNVIYGGLFLFLFSELRLEAIVRLIVIGGIVDHHYLNFLVLLILVELLSFLFISLSLPPVLCLNVLPLQLPPK